MSDNLTPDPQLRELPLFSIVRETDKLYSRLGDDAGSSTNIVRKMSSRIEEQFIEVVQRTVTDLEVMTEDLQTHQPGDQTYLGPEQNAALAEWLHSMEELMKQLIPLVGKPEWSNRLS